MAPPTDVIIGTAQTGENDVIPPTRRPKSALAIPIVLRIDQLSSKYAGGAAEAIIRGRALGLRISSKGSQE